MKRLLKLTYNNLNPNIQVSHGINRSLSHGRDICDRRYAHVDNAAEEGKQLPGGLKSEKHLAEVVKDSVEKPQRCVSRGVRQLNPKSTVLLFIIYRKRSL